MRIILHIDVDAFFPSVEMRENPKLIGKPVIVGADPKEGFGRGVVSSASYEARAYGIRSGMPISKAWKLCPHGIYLRPRFKLYQQVSAELMKFLKAHSDKFEQASIDEAYLDISTKVRNFDEAKKYAMRIKQEILKKFKISCSIGIAPNKVIAKIASAFKKPYGLTVVPEERVKEFLYPLPIQNLFGVGPKTATKLKEMGINTIGTLANTDTQTLLRVLGIWGVKLREFAQGIDNREVQDTAEIKSIGRETTFEKDTDSKALIINTLKTFAEELHMEIQKQSIYFRTVTIKIRFDNYETHTRSKTLPIYANSGDVINTYAQKLIKPYFKVNRKVRLIGLRISKFVKLDHQKSIFEVL